MTIRLAAIGVSHWHSTYDAIYFAILARMPEVQVVGIQDESAEVASKRGAVLGTPPVFTDYRDMLARTKPDFVLALGRHDMMAEVAHHLLDNNYPFIMEKPMGLNAAEVGGIVQKVEAKGAFVAVPFTYRYQPYIDRARKMLREGSFGPLSHFYFRSNRPTSARYPGWDCPWMLDPALSGGGSLRNLGSHGLDLFLLLTGEDATVVGAQVSTRGHGRGVDDYASVQLRSQSGILGTVEVGNLYPRDGTDGEFKLSGRDALLVAKDGATRLITPSGELTEPITVPESTSHMAIRDAITRWQQDQPPLAGARDCYRVVQLIDDAYKMGRS